MFSIPSSVDSGILYVLELQLEDKALVKIGVTQRDKVEERVCEILTSIWKRYRIFPQCYVKRYRTVSDVYGKEKQLHDLFEEYRYSTEYKFSGSTEIFDIELGKVVEEYDNLYNTESS
jgi:hypothetical protein